MGTLGTCCCGCCLEQADMPYTSVALLAPLDDCAGGIGDQSGFGDGNPGWGAFDGVGVGGNPGGGGVGGGTIYPLEDFVQGNCCYTADFNLACQSYTEHCGVWASQDLDFSYKAEFYKLKASYLDNPGSGDCQCTLVQTKLVDFHRTDKIYWVARYKLKAIRIHVGKISVQCDGDPNPACKFYVAASYVFEVCESALSWSGGVSIYPEFTIDYACTGNYRAGNCSLTSIWQEASAVNNCTDVLNQNPWQSCNAIDTKIISRIKLFDTLPTGQISITNSDLPPVGCCGGETGCNVIGSPCGLELVSNCVPNLPAYNGTEMTYFCQSSIYPNPGPPPYADGCEIVVGCPEVQAKQSVDFGCKEYVFDAESGCYELIQTSIKNVPGVDQFTCGFCVTAEGTTYYFSDMYGTFHDCGVPGLCTTGDCCFDFGTPEIQYNCEEFVSDEHCRVDISDYTCNIGALQTHTTGAFCFNLPTVTIELI